MWVTSSLPLFDWVGAEKTIMPQLTAQ